MIPIATGIYSLDPSPWAMPRPPPPQKSSKSVHNFLSSLAERRTDKEQTDRQENSINARSLLESVSVEVEVKQSEGMTDS